MQTTIEITEDQLAIDWTLTESDVQFINKTTNQSIKFAALLCHLRAYGRFIGKDDTVPFIALSYLAKQLGQPLSVTPVFDKNSHSYIQQEKIRNYLGYTEFNKAAQLRLEEWLVISYAKKPWTKNN